MLIYKKFQYGIVQHMYAVRKYNLAKLQVYLYINKHNSIEICLKVFLENYT